MASVSLRLSEENFFQSIREELVYLHKNYQIEGNEGDIAVHNAQVAERVGKHKCSDLWHDLFSLCLPVDSKKHTVESLFEAKIKPEFTLSDCRIIMHEQSVIQKAARKINPVDILQAIVDEN